MEQLVANNFMQNGADSLGAVTNIYESWSVFSINTIGQLQGTLWLEKNGQRVTTALGTASYQFYDKTGAAVAGLSQSNISADGNGQFIITAVSSPNIQSLNHYVVKISIMYGGEMRESYRGVEKHA